LKLNSILAGSLALVLITGLGAPAFAGEVIEEPGGETISFDFGILVTNIGFFGDEGGISSIQVLEEGDMITGTLTFDAEMPDQSPESPAFGAYPYDQVSINVDGTIFEHTLPFGGEIQITNNDAFFGGDIYSIMDFAELENPDNPEVAFFGFQLNDVDQTVFDDDSLPLTPPNLDDFEDQFFSMIILADGEIPLGVSISSPGDIALIDTIGENVIIDGEIIFFITTPVDPTPVAGELLPIDSAALLLAGAQTNAVWIMSALAVIGSVAFGALYITSKKN
jgi:hypothetical protein